MNDHTRHDTQKLFHGSKDQRLRSQDVGGIASISRPLAVWCSLL